MNAGITVLWLAASAEQAVTASRERELDIAAASRTAPLELAQRVLGMLGDRVVETRILKEEPYAGGATIQFAARARISRTPPLCVSEVISVRFRHATTAPVDAPSRLTGVEIGSVYTVLEEEPLFAAWSLRQVQDMDSRCGTRAPILRNNGRPGYFEVYLGPKRSHDDHLALFAARTMLLARGKLAGAGFLTCSDTSSRAGGVCPQIGNRLARSLPTELSALTVSPCRSATGKMCVTGTLALDGQARARSPGLVEVEVSTNAAVFDADHVPGSAEPLDLTATVFDSPVV